MNALRERALDVLSSLIAIDSQNPPRKSERVVAWLRERLVPAFDVRVTDLGDGSVSVLAVRGEPHVVYNVHVDTVPVVPGWTRDPFRAEV